VRLAQGGKRFGGEERALEMFERALAQGVTIAERSVE